MTTCKICKVKFVKDHPLQRVCGLVCAVANGQKKLAGDRAKAGRLERAETRQKLEDLATKPELTKKAQVAFNEYIRLRDFGKPCICCNKPIAWGTDKTGGVCDAGHYMSRGAHTQHKFNEDNVHAQLKHCNSPNGLGGNYANYRIGLIARIGLERVEALECDHELNHYSKDDLRAIAAKYKLMTKELQK